MLIATQDIYVSKSDASGDNVDTKIIGVVNSIPDVYDKSRLLCQPCPCYKLTTDD